VEISNPEEIATTDNLIGFILILQHDNNEIDNYVFGNRLFSAYRGIILNPPQEILYRDKEFHLVNIIRILDKTNLTYKITADNNIKFK